MIEKILILISATILVSCGHLKKDCPPCYCDCDDDEYMDYRGEDPGD